MARRPASFRDTDFGYRKIMGSLRAMDGSEGAVEVGVFEDAGVDGDLPLTDLAAIHEYGSADGRIPQRSFLRSTFDENASSIKKGIEAAILEGIDGEPAQAASFALRTGEDLVKKIQAKIRGGIAPANAESTLRQKNGSTPLIDTGELINAIRVRITPFRGKKAKKGAA